MKDIIEEYEHTQKVIDKIISDECFIQNVENISDLCVKALRNGKKIMFCGNGGSAADSQHLAAELVSRFNFDRPALCGIALTVDTSALTAIGNDYGYDRVFARQVYGIGQEGDVLFGFSTSGKSKNIIEAFKAAKEKNITTVGMLGENGRDIGDLASYSINVPSSSTPKIQEVHIMTGHIICGLIEKNIFPQYKS